MTTGEELSLNFFENQFMFYPGIGDFSVQFLFDRYNVDLNLFRKDMFLHMFGVKRYYLLCLLDIFLYVFHTGISMVLVEYILNRFVEITLLLGISWFA